MIDLILAIVCATSLGLILKHNDTKKGNPFVLINMNYLSASLVFVVIILADDTIGYSQESLYYGIGLGLLYAFAFYMFTQAVRIAGASLSSVSSRLSVVVAVVLSIIIYGEHPTTFQLFGFAAAIAVIFLFYFSVRKMSLGELHIKDYFVLLLLLLSVGVNNFGMKVFGHWRPMDERNFFLLVVFASAFLYTQIFITAKKIKYKRHTVLLGAFLGLPNIFVSFFLIGALAKLPAVLVYPVMSISVILLTTIFAMLVWKERVNNYGVAAIIAGIIAILLLTIK